jgi:hypothetical protein
MSTERQADARPITVGAMPAVLRGVLLRVTAPLIARLDQLEAANRDKVIGLLAQVDQLEAAAAERARLIQGDARDARNHN